MRRQRPMRLDRLFLTAVMALFILVTSAESKPPVEYGSYFDPVEKMLAPCMEKGEACLGEGRVRDECEAVVEACLDDFDNEAREERYTERAGASGDSKAMTACEDIIKECFEETRDMDSCVVGVLRCRENGAKEPYPCCPKGCIEDYKGLVNSGAPEIDAFLTVFSSNKSACYYQ